MEPIKDQIKGKIEENRGFSSRIDGICDFLKEWLDVHGLDAEGMCLPQLGDDAGKWYAQEGIAGNDGAKREMYLYFYGNKVEMPNFVWHLLKEYDHDFTVTYDGKLKRKGTDLYAYHALVSTIQTYERNDYYWMVRQTYLAYDGNRRNDLWLVECIEKHGTGDPECWNKKNEVLQENDLSFLGKKVLNYWEDAFQAVLKNKMARQWQPKEIRELQEKLDEVAKLENDTESVTIEKNNHEMYERIWLLWKDYEISKETNPDEAHIPNIAVMGPAGVGKTHLVKVLGLLFDARVKAFGASDLKGAYVGQTEKAVYDVFLKALDLAVVEEKTGEGCTRLRLVKNKKSAAKNVIVFIDEVYTLMSDEFGREAASILLPIMSGDRTEVSVQNISYRTSDGQNLPYPAIDLTSKEYPGISIWIAGYEGPTRRMLQQNAGLYRRLEKLTIKTPTVERLMEVFESEMKKAGVTVEAKKLERIQEFFAWATSPEHAVFFANYAGVKDFSKKLVTMKMAEKENKEEGKDAKEADKSFDGAVDRVVELTRKEIESQYASVLTTTDEQLRKEIQEEIGEFRVISSIPNTELIGNDKTRGQMDELVRMIFNQKEYKECGIRIPKGVLFVGPPGTGKSYMAKYMAYRIQEEYRRSDDKDHRVGFVAVASTEISEPEKVSKLFAEAKKFEDCLVFIDEIDFIARSRTNGNPYAAAMSRLMTEMDGFESGNHILVLAATNDPDSMDPAMKRPGRFDRIIEISTPDKADRKKLLKYYLDKTCFKDFVSEEVVERIAHSTMGFSTVELRHVVNEAVLRYVSETMMVDSQLSPEMVENELMEQIDRLLVGERRKREKGEFCLEKNEGASATAIHEVGHALVAVMEYGGEKPFDEITIIPRGEAEGFVRRSGNEHNLTKQNLLKDIRIKLGGRVAEEIFYGADKISAGAVQDISDCTDIAWRMVFLYGMSDMGPVALASRTGRYLDSRVEYLCSAETRARADEKVQQIIRSEFENVHGILFEKKDILKKLAERVFEEEKMSGESFVGAYHELVENR